MVNDTIRTRNTAITKKQKTLLKNIQVHQKKKKAGGGGRVRVLREENVQIKSNLLGVAVNHVDFFQ